MPFAELAQIRLPSRDAAGELRRQFLRLLRAEHPEPGSRLMTEAELMAITRVSRSTIRRALKPLECEGWIDRRAGAGTFVGPRIRELINASAHPGGIGSRDPNTPNGDRTTDTDTADRLRMRRSRGIVRVAVLIHNIGDLANDWYTPGVLEGLDDAGHDYRVVVELLGDRDRDRPTDVDSISRRLELSRPDVLVCLSSRQKHAFVIRDAQRLGIQCFVSGAPHAGLDVPGVCEDNRQAMALAVGHLIDNRHQRIGAILPRLAEPWVFERLETFNATSIARGAVPMVHWTSPEIDAAGSQAEAAEIERFIKDNRLTAVIPAHGACMRMLDAIVREGRMRVPEDVSVVSFEQDHVARRYLGHADATRVQLPLREMGRHLAGLAKATVEDGKNESGHIRLPSVLVSGCTVALLSADGGGPS